MKHIPSMLILLLLTAAHVYSQAQTTNNQERLTHQDTSQDTAIGPKLFVNSIAASASANASAVPDIVFNEFPINHNMHITSDGSYYYTINGGYYEWGQINKFSLDGNLLQTYPVKIDGRGLSYNQADGYLYASVYMGDIVRITNLESSSFETVFTGLMQNEQASFAISTDGSKIFNFYQGVLKIHDFNTGAVVNTITGLSFGFSNFGGEAVVAVDQDHIFTWNAHIRTVYIYNQSGTFIRSVVLNYGDNGHSLSVANGLLFVSKDGNYDVGTWYGTAIASLLPKPIDVKCGKRGEKVLVCHKGKSLCISKSAVPAHLRHGDKRGACGINSSLIVRSNTLQEEAVSEGLSVVTAPNPSTAYFTLQISSANTTDKVSLWVVDAIGRIVEYKNGLTANCTHRVGDKYRPGMYFAQVLQGGKVVTVKLVKQ